MKGKADLDYLMQNALSRGRELMGRPYKEQDENDDGESNHFRASGTYNNRVEEKDVSLSPSRDKIIRSNASKDMRDLNYNIDFDEREHDSGLKKLIASRINRHVDRLQSQSNTLGVPANDTQDNMSFGGEEELAQESQNPYSYIENDGKNKPDSRDKYHYHEADQDGYGDAGRNEDDYRYGQDDAEDNYAEEIREDLEDSDPIYSRTYETRDNQQDRNVFGAASEHIPVSKYGAHVDHRVNVKTESNNLKDSVWPGTKGSPTLVPHTSENTRNHREVHDELEDCNNDADHDHREDYHTANHERDAYLGSRLSTQRLEVKQYTPLNRERQNKSVTKSTKATKTIAAQSIDNLRKTTALERREIPVVKPGDTIVEHLDESLLLNQYHDLKSKEVHLTKGNIKFALNRINPPRCLLDALEALFSLLYGLYDRIEPHFFSITEKKYFLYKAYLQHSVNLLDVTNHLKYYMETQGLPARNVQKADECLVRYATTIKRAEARDYKAATDQIADFVRFHINYYHVLRVKA